MIIFKLFSGWHDRKGSRQRAVKATSHTISVESKRRALAGRKVVTGPAYLSGQILIISVIFLSVIIILSVSLFSRVTNFVRFGSNSVMREQAVNLAEAGIDKALWQLNETAGTYTGETNTPLGSSGTFTITVVDKSPGIKTITVTGFVPSAASPKQKQTIKVDTSIATDAISFRYGVQIGSGGLSMDENSQVNGNVYANGPISGRKKNKETITGDAWAAGNNTIDKINTDGDMHAHTITDSNIGQDAYFQSISSSTVIGVSYPGSPDPPAEPLPISQSQIDDWKQEAQTGGTITGNYQPTGNVSLGPKEITGNLILNDNSQILTLTGTLWIHGNITLDNLVKIQLDSGFGSNSGVIIADGWIHVDNNGDIRGSGQSNSYILALSTLNCLGNDQPGCTGHHNGAIDLHNNVTSAIIYAAAGLLNLHNNVALKEAVAEKMDMNNGTIVSYESGLANVQFSSGPGGSWAIRKGTYHFK